MSTAHLSKDFRTITLLLPLLACSGSTPAQSIDTPAAAPVPAGAQVIGNFQEHAVSQHGDWWMIDLKYPAVDGADDFNAAIRQHVNAMADKFRKGLPKTASSGYPDYGAYLKGTYTAQALKNGVITVLFDYGEYTPGAAHPWGVMASINYDTRGHRVLTLSDLFWPESGYVSRLSRISIDTLDQHEYADTEAIRRGAGPVEKNFEVFTLTETELILHFQQYQVAPGVVPSEQVAILLTDLAPLLRKRYMPTQ
jgi:peptidoglycan-N-acetylmuramic acid deacetylase PdaC-like protein/uncharacterized protein DUF3298